MFAFNDIANEYAKRAMGRVGYRLRYRSSNWQDALVGKNVVVVGAGAGLGAATARLMAECGANVVPCGLLEDDDPNEPGLAAIAAFCNTWAVVLDVTDQDSVTDGVEQIVDRLYERTGRREIDFLVHVAGVADPTLEFEKLKGDRKAFERMVRVNVYGLHNVLEAAGKYVRRPGGSVAYFSSMAALVPLPGMGIYAAHKAGGLNQFEVLDQEYWLEGVNCTTIILSPIASRMTTHGRNSGAAAPIRGIIDRMTIPQAEAIEIIVEGVARRYRRVYVPKTGRLLDFLPPILLRSYKLLTRAVAPDVVKSHREQHPFDHSMKITEAK